VEGRSPYYITYTEAEVDFGAQLVDGFVKMDEPVRQVALVEEYVRDCGARSETPDAASIEKCCSVLDQRASAIGASRPADAFVLRLASRRIRQVAELPTSECRAEELLTTADDVITLIASVPDAALQQLACEMLVAAKPDEYQELLLSFLPKLSMAACDWCAKHLQEAGVAPEQIVAQAQVIASAPVEHFEAMLWLWNGPDVEGIEGAIPLVSVLFGILRGLEESRLQDHIDRSVAVKLGGRARAVLGARKFERFVTCAETLERGMAQALRRQLNTTDNLGRAVREDFLRILDARFPRVSEAVVLKPWERDETLYVTEQGLGRKQKEIEHHVNVKMRDNARAIGEAAEKGDLSENSEYKFALEERDLLRARLAQMNAEVAMAQVLRPGDVPEDEIGVGSRAVFRKLSDGSQYELTFLGPWEADFDKGILNYRSPLGMELMGIRVGDQVEFEHRNASGVYQLESVSNALVEASNV
jgi:transcription elongation factor GreA